MKDMLTTAEWRLYLLSECLKYDTGLYEYTRKLRAEGKEAILGITYEDAKELGYFVSEQDVPKIRAMLRKEWKFTGKVIDNGKGNLSTCEYCQSQQIRYRYLCINERNRTWLSLGSVCVGKIIHGEDKMADREFSKNFVSDLDRLKSNAQTEEEAMKSPMEAGPEKPKPDSEVRLEQRALIDPCMAYLRKYNRAKGEFIRGLERRWSSGRPLTDRQLEALIDMTKKVRDEVNNGGSPVFKSIEAEAHYQKVILKIQDHPDSSFLQSCKLRLERFGELTPNMIKALMGSKEDAS